MIYDGAVRDKTNFCSNEYITVNSCNIQKSGGKPYTVIRERGRVDYHILYIAEGECLCLYDGKEEVMTKGCFVIYPPSVKQRYSFVEGKYVKSLWIHFSGYGVREIFDKLGLRGGIFRALNESKVENSFERIIFDHSVSTAQSRISAEGELIKLLSLLSGEKEKKNTGASSGPAIKMLEYIHSNWQNPITVADIAKKICLSESRTAHLFKSAVGKGIHQYVKDLRISSAKELLSGSDLSIAEIGRMVGFQDQLYFSRAFKSEVHLSPREFRNSLQHL